MGVLAPTTIRFSLPTAASGRLDVFGVDGRRVATLAEGAFAAGAHELRWDGRDQLGERVASGTYLARLAAGGMHQALGLSGED